MNEHQQGQWRLDRAGKITASCYVDIVKKKQDGTYTEARGQYMRELAFERLAGAPLHEIGGKAMSWGKSIEGQAIAEYEIRTGLSVKQVGFFIHPDLPFVGCSPDGLVGDDGGVEVKCPHSEHVHIRTWIDGIPEEHVPQVQGAMWCMGRKWWDFLSFDPRLGNCDLALYRERIEADTKYHTMLTEECYQFEMELRKMVDWLKTRGERIWTIEEVA